ncbi:MAG: UDP-N-acetylmuramoyl-tripeptide--D-alanyl-D-alanine ligase [Bacillota bacterium]
MQITGNELIQACAGIVQQGNPDSAITGFSIDSRRITPGDFFVPLPGEREDGHRYVGQALERGAAGSFYSRIPVPPLPSGSLIIRVGDVLTALQQVAAAYRTRFDLPVIGVTGSSGKTTTKDLIAGVLSSRLEVLKTEGNLNNEIGLPLTLLTLEEHHQAAVLEMGMSAPGEIAILAKMARPAIGVISNIGEAHLERLGSREAIARAKEELLDYIGSGGTAVLNGDDDRLVQMGKRFPGKAYYYGFSRGDVRCTKLSQQGENSFFRVRFPNRSERSFSLPLPGRHLVSNALAALTIGYLFQIGPAEMETGLQASRVTGGRLQIRRTGRGVRVIDDSYNANPSSVKAALEVLRDLGGSKGVAVLGEMLELGPTAAEEHRQVGRFAARCGIARLVTVGALAGEAAAAARAAGLAAIACADHAEAVSALNELPLDQSWTVLVKGSRGARMDQLVQALLKEPEGETK